MIKFNGLNNPLLRVLLFIIFLALSACEDSVSASTSDTSPNDTSQTVNNLNEAVISSAGGQVQSSDQKLTLSIPAGALTADTKISIEKISPDSLGSNFDGIASQASYRFEPAGTQFIKPVKLKLELDKVTVDPNKPTASMPAVLLDSNGKLTGLDNVQYQLNADTGVATILADIPHFSTLVVSSNQKDGVTLSTVYLEDVPTSAYAYEPFEFSAGSVEARAQFTRVDHLYYGEDIIIKKSANAFNLFDRGGTSSISAPLGYFTEKPNEAFVPLIHAICTDPNNKTFISVEGLHSFDLSSATEQVIFRILNSSTNKYSPKNQTSPISITVWVPFICKAPRDTDGDGLNTEYEFLVKTDPNDPDSDDNGTNDGKEDFDGDGLSNLQEQTLGSDPTKTDSDFNGINDGDEDKDGDGLTTLQELTAGTDPNGADTDGGGINDGKEVNVDKTNPLDPFDDGKIVRICPETIGVNETIPVGLKALPTSRNGLEQIRFTVDIFELVAGSISSSCVNEAPLVKTSTKATPGFTSAVPSGTVATTVATNQQWDMINLKDNSPVSFSHFHEAVNYQAIVPMREQALSTHNAAVLAVGIIQPGIFGFNGGAMVFDRQGKSADSLLQCDAYDAQTVGGGFLATQALIACNEQVNLFTLLDSPIGSQGEMLDAISPLFMRDDVDSGATQILSAYQQVSNGPVLVLTDGRQSSQELFVIDPATKASQKFAGTGLQQNKIVNPRQLRCLDDICVVSHFGGQRDDTSIDPGGITILNWTGTGNITDGAIIATVPLGTESAPSGIVGVSLIGDGRGNVAIAAAGFTSGEVYELVVENGKVTRTLSQAVANGCSNPGHVQYLPDAEGLKWVASCYNSSNYVVGKSKLQ